MSEPHVVQPPPVAGESAESAAAQALPVPMVPSPPSVPGVPSTVPYRTVPQEALEPAPPRAWPVMGSALWVFGVSMWAFLVMGELTTSYGPGKRDLLVGEGLAAMLVLGTGIAAWVYAIRRMLASRPARGIVHGAARAVAVAVLAFIMWFLVTIAATIVGESSRKNLDGKITVALILLAAAAAFGGRWMTRVQAGGGTGARKAWWAIGIGAGVLTLVTLIEVIATD
jgi:hypothetical protein